MHGTGPRRRLAFRSRDHLADTPAACTLGRGGAIQLYDLSVDVGETNDVAGRRPDVVEPNTADS